MTEEDLNRTMKSCGGSIQTTVHDLNDTTLGQCALFEEKSFRVLYPYRLLEITFKITNAQLSLKHRPMFKASSISDSQ